MSYDPNYISLLSSSISSSAAAEQRLTNELSSGLRVGRLSDDPVASSSNVLLAASISRVDAFTTAATSNQSLLQVADSALGDVVTQVTSAISLAVGAGNGTLNAANIASTAKQVSDIRDNVAALGNTSYLGNYIFSGSAGNTKPFTTDTTTDPATTTYSGDAVTRSVSTPDGQQIAINVPGSAVFTASGSNLLGTLNQLVSDLQSGNTSAVTADSSSLSDALKTVTTQRSLIDSSLSRLNVTSAYESTQQTLVRAQQSELLSADPAEVATELQTASVQHQALLGVVASLDKVNLFDYLK